jgi:hypothetical protein
MSSKQLSYFIGQTAFAWPPVLGREGLMWAEVFALIKQPHMLWEVYKPEKPLKDLDVATLWRMWNSGEQLFDNQERLQGIKPPLRELEQTFNHQWRASSQAVSSFFALLL